jgi:hypothetical protein
MHGSVIEVVLWGPWAAWLCNVEIVRSIMLRGVTLIDEALFANDLYEEGAASQGWRRGGCLLIFALPWIIVDMEEGRMWCIAVWCMVKFIWVDNQDWRAGWGVGSNFDVRRIGFDMCLSELSPLSLSRKRLTDARLLAARCTSGTLQARGSCIHHDTKCFPLSTWHLLQSKILHAEEFEEEHKQRLLHS